MRRKEAIALGLKTYCTGKPCKRGHLVERKTHNGHCPECNAPQKRALYARNGERIRAQNRAWWRKRALQSVTVPGHRDETAPALK